MEVGYSGCVATSIHVAFYNISAKCALIRGTGLRGYRQQKAVHRTPKTKTGLWLGWQKYGIRPDLSPDRLCSSIPGDGDGVFF